MSEAMFYQLMHGIEDIFVPLGICVVLPVMVVWLAVRHRTNDTNKRTEIVLAAINKNSDVDIEELLKKLNPPRKSVKEKLLQKLTWASVLMAIGILLGGFSMIMDYRGEGDPSNIRFFEFISGICFFIGLAILITFFVGKKMMAKELEAENNRIVQ